MLTIPYLDLYTLYTLALYSFNQIPLFIFTNAHVTSLKHTGLVRFVHWSEIFVLL